MNNTINELLDALEESTSIMRYNITNCRSCEECEECALFPCMAIRQVNKNKDIINRIKSKSHESNLYSDRFPDVRDMFHELPECLCSDRNSEV